MLRRATGHWLISKSVPGPIDYTHPLATEFFADEVAIDSLANRGWETKLDENVKPRSKAKSMKTAGINYEFSDPKADVKGVSEACEC